VKHCPRCGRRLPWEAFGRNLAQSDGHQSWCRDCMREHRQERRTTTGEGLPYLRAYQLANGLTGRAVNCGAYIRRS